MAELLTERLENEIAGVLSCFDRLVFFGTYKEIGYPDAMSKHLHYAGVRLLDYQKIYANEQRLKMVARVQEVAREEGLAIEHVLGSVRKEALVAGILEKRGRHEGIVCILSSMEACRCFKVGKDRKSGYLQLQWSPGKCLHYYVYFIDAEYGLCYLRIPTWAPFRLQFYCNAHDWLERRMKAEGIEFEKADNCFVHIGDFARAQALADGFDVRRLHERIDKVVGRFVAVHERFGHSLHWSIYQAERATDIVFRNDQILPALYEQIVRTAVLEIKCPDVYRFLGKRLTSRSAQEVSNRLQTLVEGTRIKHTLGSTSIKMYDKQDRVLRIETTTSDVSSFSCHRKVESQADGACDPKRAPIRKTIYSLGALAEAMDACNQRYLRFISQWPDRTAEQHDLKAVVESKRDEKERSYRGVNFFRQEDLVFLNAILRGEYQIAGVRNRLLQAHLPGWSPQKIGRTLRRFHILGLLKRVAGTTKYYLTKLGSSVLVAALQLRERVVLPAFASA